MWWYLYFLFIIVNVKFFMYLVMLNSFVLYCCFFYVFYIIINVLFLLVDLGWWVLNKGWIFLGCILKNGDERFVIVIVGIE